MKNYYFIRLHCLIYTLLKWDSLDRLIITLQSKYLYMLKAKFISDRQYSVLFSLAVERRLIRTKVNTSFNLAWKEKTHKPAKVAAKSICFHSLYVIGTTYFENWFLLLLFYFVMLWRTSYIQVSCYSDVFINHHIVALFTKFFWNKPISLLCYTN